MNRRQPRPWNKKPESVFDSAPLQDSDTHVNQPSSPDDMYGVRLWIPSVKANFPPCPTCGDPLRMCGCAIGLTPEVRNDSVKFHAWMDAAYPASEQESVLVSETDIVPVGEFRGRYSSTGA